MKEVVSVSCIKPVENIVCYAVQCVLFNDLPNKFILEPNARANFCLCLLMGTFSLVR